VVKKVLLIALLVSAKAFGQEEIGYLECFVKNNYISGMSSAEIGRMFDKEVEALKERNNFQSEQSLYSLEPYQADLINVFRRTIHAKPGDLWYLSWLEGKQFYVFYVIQTNENGGFFYWGSLLW